MITDSRYFVGREEVLRSLTEKLVGAQPISVNVVGERRIGKSSLLYHFFLTYEQRVQARQADPNRVYALIYLSLKQAQCQEQAGFYQAVAQKLLHWAQAKQKPELMAAWGVVDDLDRCQFSAALDAWHERGVLPAVCLDEFEEFLEQPEQFDDHFFDHLRALLDRQVLMVVVASQRALDAYLRQHSQLSKLPNGMHVEPLASFVDYMEFHKLNAPL